MAVILFIVITIVAVAAAFIIDLVFGREIIRKAQAWNGVVIDKSKSSQGSQETYHYITVRLESGAVKNIQVRANLWKFLHKGDKVTKHPGHYDPSKD